MLAWYKNYKYIKGHDRTLFFLLQQTSNNHSSPAKQFPELGATLVKFVRKEVGDQAILPKVPMFQQDMEHILDCVGIKTQSDLQRE